MHKNGGKIQKDSRTAGNRRPGTRNPETRRPGTRNLKPRPGSKSGAAASDPWLNAFGVHECKN